MSDCVQEAKGILREAVWFARSEGIRNQAWVAAAVSWLDEYDVGAMPPPPPTSRLEWWNSLAPEQQDALIAQGWHP